MSGGTGNITLWLNSPGGDCVAAAQIYNMLSEYNGKVTVKIDGLAASAASVIAMAGDEVLMSPVSTMMIHNPSTIAAGDHADMQRAMDMLNEFKESIINAYVVKTGLSRAKLSHLMDSETWMNANKAVELGFADGILSRKGTEDTSPEDMSAVLFSHRAVNNAFLNKVTAKYKKEDSTIPQQTSKDTERSADRIIERLNVIKKHI